MTQPPVPAPGPRTRPPGPRLLTSFIVGGLGILLGIAAAIGIAIPLAGSFTSPRYAVPGDLRVHLHDAKYTVYQFTGTRSVFGNSDSIGAVRIEPSVVAVTAPDGTSVPVFRTDANEELTRNRDVYTASLEFDAPADGLYLLRFRNAIPTQVIVSRSILDALQGVWGWFVVGGIGGLLFVTGVVMLIVGAVRRGRAKRAAYAGWGAPPQWGPPPQQQWGPPPQQQQWAPPQPQWGPPPQQPQWAPPPATPTAPPPPPAEPPPADPPA
jgi:hypothetical protein